ncbi:MAG TPA: hypothetical protein VGJ33_08675 [Candidatus Angelobacter sp.]
MINLVQSSFLTTKSEQFSSKPERKAVSSLTIRDALRQGKSAARGEFALRMEEAKELIHAEIFFQSDIYPPAACGRNAGLWLASAHWPDTGKTGAA